MQIDFEQSGGFLGLRFSLSLNLDELPPDQAETLRGQLDNARFFTLPENPVTRSVPDELHYTITVKTTTEIHTVRVGDRSSPDELRPLIQELSMRARTQNR